jgi:hypothetical protein
MGQMAVSGDPRFAIEPLFLAEEEGRPVLVAVVKVTCTWATGQAIVVEDKPVPVNLAGQYRSDLPDSSYLYEPETALSKPATDVVLIGHAHSGGRSCVDVSISVGKLTKTVRAHGDRFWYRSFTGIERTQPAAFEKIPLEYERAFGGWDRTDSDLENHRFEPRNPAGVGFRLRKSPLKGEVPLPNLEDPRYPICQYGDTPPPAGFGFTSPHWHPRSVYAGTYDDAWTRTRSPLLPVDFDRRFFNAASPGLVATGYLKGGEAVAIENATPEGWLRFDLPGLSPPRCRLRLRGRKDEFLETNLDTVIINADEKLLFLIWRAALALRNGPTDVESIDVRV